MSFQEDTVHPDSRLHGSSSGKPIRVRILPPLSVLAGVAAALLVVANGSFHGFATNATAAWALTFGIVVFGAAITQAPRSIEMGLVPIVFIIPAIHFLWPLLGTTHQLILVDAGDFNQYLGLGSWLTSHPLNEAPHLGADYNTLQLNLWDHVSNFLRPGGIFLLSLFGSLSSREIGEIYTPFLAFGLGLQALGIYLFALAAFERLPPLACALIAVLFTISPAATWPAYASFLPQTVGMAFLLATTGTVIAVIQQWPQLSPRDETILGGALALSTFATLSIYPESSPLGAIICALFAFLSYRAIAAKGIGRFATYFCSVLALAIVMSPDSFLWAARGFWVQLGSFAHGGEQVSTPYTLLSAVLASIQLPLVEALLNQVPPAFRILSFVNVALGSLGLLGVIFLERQRIAYAVLAASILLFATVMLKYSSENFRSYALWPQLFSWNLFKAAQYTAPFVTIVALGGLILSSSRFFGHYAYIVVCPIMTCISLAIAIGQDLQAWPRGYKTELSRDTIDFLRQLPNDGRLLISLEGELHPYRYLIYGVLKERHFLSTEDWQAPEFDSSASVRARILSEPISYVLADGAGTIDGLPVLQKSGRFRVLDARSATFTHKINGFNIRPAVLLFTPQGLRIAP
jgi:hypothetical protein